MVWITMRQSAVLTSGQALSVRTFEDATSEWTKAADLGTRLRAAVKEEVSRFINAWGIATGSKVCKSHEAAGCSQPRKVAGRQGFELR